MRSKPEISVLFPVRNAVNFLSEALSSLAVQVSRDFEVVAVNDGSTDGSGEMLEGFAKEYRWLKVLHQEKSGIAIALNRAFSASRGDLIARMDADDVADPRRLAIQAEFFASHPTIGVCGSWARVFGGEGEAVIRPPVADDAIRSWLVFGSAFVHPAVMMRRDVLLRLEGPYRTGVEDYDLWVRLAEMTLMHNIPVVLLRYRRHPSQTTQSANEARILQAEKVRMELLTRLGINYSATERRVHACLGLETSEGERPLFRDVADWLERLITAIPASGWCSESALRLACANAWWRYMQKGHGGPASAWMFGRAAVAGRTPRTLFRMARLALR